MKRAYLDHVAINDINELLCKIRQHMWTLDYNRELTDEERVAELKNIAEQAKSLAKTAKTFYKDYAFAVSILAE